MSNADEFVLCSASGYDLCSNLHNLLSRSTGAFDLVLPSPQTSISSATHNMPSRPLSVWSCRRWNSPGVDLTYHVNKSCRKISNIIITRHIMLRFTSSIFCVEAHSIIYRLNFWVSTTEGVRY